MRPLRGLESGGPIGQDVGDQGKNEDFFLGF